MHVKMYIVLATYWLNDNILINVLELGLCFNYLKVPIRLLRVVDNIYVYIIMYIQYTYISSKYFMTMKRNFRIFYYRQTFAEIIVKEYY